MNAGVIENLRPVRQVGRRVDDVGDVGFCGISVEAEERLTFFFAYCRQTTPGVSAEGKFERIAEQIWNPLAQRIGLRMREGVVGIGEVFLEPSVPTWTRECLPEKAEGIQPEGPQAVMEVVPEVNPD